MPNEHLIVSSKRLGIDLRDLKTSLRKNYSSPSHQVVSGELRKKAATLAETWIADLSQRPEMTICVSAKYLADLNVHFQRILICTEKASVRRRYEEEITIILKDYTANIIVPLMQGMARVEPSKFTAINGTEAKTAQPAAEGFSPTAFIGHSFDSKDASIVRCVTKTLECIGIHVVTGQKPRADRISNKVKELIDAQHIFVGIFTCRDKLVGKNKWSTSTWVIDEKAYASKTKKLILLKEENVDSIGGIQGDHEFIEFKREHFDEAIVSLLQLFTLAVDGFQ